MSRDLFLLRHAKSDWDTGAGTDFDRPLARRGRKAIKRMARWLRDRAVAPDLVISSTAERARQTTLRLCRFAEIAESLVAWEPRIYEADLQTLQRVLSEVSDDKRKVVLVGHNPGLEHLVRYLADASLSDWESTNLMPTAALAHLGTTGPWSALGRESARLHGIHRPRELFS